MNSNGLFSIVMLVFGEVTPERIKKTFCLFAEGDSFTDSTMKNHRLGNMFVCKVFPNHRTTADLRNLVVLRSIDSSKNPIPDGHRIG